MNKEYLTVKEFSELAQVTPQYIYKQLNNKKNNHLQTSLKIENGKKYINIQALKCFKKDEVVKQSEQSLNQNNNQLNDSLIKQIEFLQSQLEQKDNQLSEKDKQIEKLHQITENQQVLLKNEQEKLLLLENKTGKGLFQRFFKRR